MLWAFLQDLPTRWLLDHYLCSEYICSEYGEFNHLTIILTDTIPIGYIPKRSYVWKPNIDPFPPTTKPRPLNPLDCGPTSHKFAGYRLVVLQPFYACSTIFYFCLLSFPRDFCRSKLVLFRSVACFCLISSCISYWVCHFL